MQTFSPNSSFGLKTNFTTDNKYFQLFSLKLQAYVIIFEKMSIKYSRLNIIIVCQLKFQVKMGFQQNKNDKFSSQLSCTNA